MVRYDILTRAPGREWGWLAGLIGWAGLTLALPLGACNVPVFRYALERWHPEEYELVLFHQGAWTEAEQAVVKRLDPYEQEAPVNYVVRPVDLAANPDERSQTLWAQQTNATLPWMVLRAPPDTAEELRIWAGPMTAANARALVESPARQTVVRHLLAGDTAAWVLLEAGVAAADQAAWVLLTNELAKAERAIELPTAAPDDPRMASGLPLRVRFPLVRVSRGDPAEAMFVRTMLHGAEAVVEPSLPVAIPIFGRGRALAALAGPQLTADIIQEACAFICGICSCEIKELNPGKDLLLAAAWDNIFDGAPPVAAEETRAPLPIPVIADGPPMTTAPLPATPVPGSGPATRFSMPRKLKLGVLIVTGALVVVTGVMAFRLRTKR